jgi:nucleotide-binding universal stress UspA family protein
MKKILVPIDFSEYSINALNYAAELAKHNEYKIVLLNIIEAAQGIDFNTYADSHNESGMVQVFMLKYIEKVKKDLGNLANKPEYKGLIDSYSVKIDKVYDRISETISEVSADLVVLGTKGVSGIEEIIMGSNAEKVVRLASCPVIAIKGDQKYAGLKNIVFASNFEEDIPNIVERLKGFASFNQAKIHLVRINTPGDFITTTESKKLIGSFAEKAGIENYTVNDFSHRTEEEGIVEFAQSVGADLISMMTHGYTGLSRLFNHSIAEDLVNSSPLPILTFNINLEKQDRFLMFFFPASATTIPYKYFPDKARKDYVLKICKYFLSTSS